MDKPTTLWNVITGMDNPEKFLGLIFFALVGVMLSLLLQTTARNPNSESTPFKFSWKFLWKDNVKRILASIVLIYVALRFSPQLIGVDITEFFAFAIGFGLDKLSEQIKMKTNILGK
jgi:hypothetical protein